ncbi:uncharacterized protein LOC115316839 isoform X2 [Ixodes scapularis]|uniref:uncharacterized protein LOC115316839 isoform X2 n=1 Tax=Ixodes scapularis TaxID=6945 RepID=UPI001A9D0253|nr:uncharacterized protein LOC115316839 isoform X2 [Ixodes scapularis]
MLVDVYTEFDLDTQKVVGTVTDNGSNFVKAFKEFGIDSQSEDNKAQLRTLSKKLDLTTFRDAELEFLEEYRDIIYPIATAINILQKSTNGHYGELLPTLTTVQKKLNAIQPKTRTSAVILDSVREGLHKRFGTFLRMENEEALIATCSHPFFKLRWTSKEDGRASNLEDLLVRAAETCGFVPEPLPEEESFPAPEDSFFEFDVQTPPPRTPQHHLRAEVYRYLEDQRHEMCMLHDFPP